MNRELGKYIAYRRRSPVWGHPERSQPGGFLDFKNHFWLEKKRDRGNDVCSNLLCFFALLFVPNPFPPPVVVPPNTPPSFQGLPYLWFSMRIDIGDGGKEREALGHSRRYFLNWLSPPSLDTGRHLNKRREFLHIPCPRFCLTCYFLFCILNPSPNKVFSLITHAI